jgi:DnaK suppressor protein
VTPHDRDAVRRVMISEIERIDNQIAALARSVADIVEAAALVNTDDEHDPEGATIAFERQQASALLQQARADRQALGESLDRIDDDRFGICEACQAAIGTERLMALPWARRCVGCAG